MDVWARASIHYCSRFVFTVVALLSSFTLVEKRARFPFPFPPVFNGRVAVDRNPPRA